MWMGLTLDTGIARIGIVHECFPFFQLTSILGRHFLPDETSKDVLVAWLWMNLDSARINLFQDVPGTSEFKQLLVEHIQFQRNQKEDRNEVLRITFRGSTEGSWLGCPAFRR